MKNIILTWSLIIGANMVFAQTLVEDQNPNYEVSLKKYSEELKNEPNTMATTVQNTYKAIDKWQEAKDAKIANRKARIESRRERRLARANNYAYYNPNPGVIYAYPNDFGYYNNFNNYNGYYGRNRRFRRNGFGVYPRVGCTVGAGIGLGNNLFLSF